LTLSNQYSRTWFEYFLETRPFTAQEVAFVARNLPLPEYERILDAPCGSGRIGSPLARLGYRIVGVDRDGPALVRARAKSPATAHFVQLDMRHLAAVQGEFDGIVCLWQSFGYFDDAENEAVLAHFSHLLAPGGRLILDIYNREHWEQNQGEVEVERKGVTIKIANRIEGKRLRAAVHYGSGLGGEQFEWRLYTLDEIRALAIDVGLTLRLACVESEESLPVSSEKPQMQLVFERAYG
jgi:SAM-dependent methyltransferase